MISEVNQSIRKLFLAPVFTVWLQICEQVSRPRLHGDAVLVQSDHVGRDLRPVAVRLLPLQEQASGGRVARFRGGRDVQEGEGGDRVGICRRSPEGHLLAVRTCSCLIHRLGKQRGR